MDDARVEIAALSASVAGLSRRMDEARQDQRDVFQQQRDQHAQNIVRLDRIDANFTRLNGSVTLHKEQIGTLQDGYKTIKDAVTQASLKVYAAIGVAAFGAGWALAWAIFLRGKP